MSQALILIDFVNDITHLEGKMGKLGNAQTAAELDTIDNAKNVLEWFRKKEKLVIHVRVGFSPDYKEVNPSSPLFGHAKKNQALLLGSWGTEFLTDLTPISGEAVVLKHRVNAFFDTQLESVLRVNNIEEIFIAGITTDLSVQTTARDGHDRDYKVNVLSDCCAAKTKEIHETALSLLPRIATVVTSREIITG